MPVVDSNNLANHLGVAAVDSETSGALSIAIEVSEAYLAGYLGKQFLTEELTARFDRFCTPLRLPRSPVQSISSITYLNEQGELTDLDPTEYLASPVGTDDPTYIYPNSSGWPATYPVAGAVTVTYSAGYGAAVDVPTAIHGGILLLAAHIYAQGATLEHLAGIPEEVFTLVQGHRDWTF